jgi:hemolysin III
MTLLTARTDYSRAEFLSDAVVHVSGVIVALLAAPVLIVLSVLLRGDLPAVIGTSVYGATLVAMILCSALYNLSHPGPWTGVLRRLDHSAIYAKIAGTYTPFVLLTGQGAWLVVMLWAAALAGMALKVVSPDRFRWPGLALYLVMGWAGLAAGDPFFAALSPAAFALILTGGALYTTGIFFYLFDRLPFHYTAWHVLVFAASLVLYSAVTVQLMQTAA